MNTHSSPSVFIGSSYDDSMGNNTIMINEEITSYVLGTYESQNFWFSNLIKWVTY